MPNVTNTISKRYLYGREQIQTDETEINGNNILNVLNKAIQTHDKNNTEINYLYNYYKGKQAVTAKVKEVRPEINNIVVENRANEIISFKLGYTFGEPIQYIRRGEEETITEALDMFNENLYMADKFTLDTELAEWMLICGVGYRFIYPTKPTDDDYEETAFKIAIADPRNTFIVYTNDLKKKPLMAVTYVKRLDDNSNVYTCYTKDNIYYIKGIAELKIDKIENNVLNALPIIEYDLNNVRMGAFEPVLTLLDALNDVQSNRLDDIVQYVNSFLALIGAELTEEGYKKLEQMKMLMLPEGTDAKYLSSPMKQADVQQLKDDLYQSILTICGMPNRNGGSSTSDTGSAVLLRDGWETAEAQAKSVEKMFKKSERQFLKIALRILKGKIGITLNLSQIEIKFARRYTDNILTKTQALSQLLDAGIAPEVCVATSGIWNDPTDVFLQSKEYLDERWSTEEEKEPQQQLGEEDNDVLSRNGSTTQDIEKKN